MIAPPKVKEPRFFSGPAPRDESSLPDAMRSSGQYQNGIEWYDALFEGETDERYRIDFTTYYAITPDTPDLVCRHYPDPKLILILRDPVQRFVSHYYQYLKIGVSLPEIKEVIRGGNAVSEMMYDFSDYRSIHARYARAFGEDTTLLLDFAELASDQARITAQCNAFLDIEDIDYSPSEREKNVAGKPRFKALQRAMFSNTARRVLRGIPPTLKTRMLKVRKKVLFANVKSEPYPELPSPLLQELSEKLAPQTAFYNRLQTRATSV